MNYKYYKFQMLDSDFKNNINEIRYNSCYEKINDFLFDDKKIEIYYIKKNTNISKVMYNSYVIYIEAERIDGDDLDLIVNCYTKNKEIGQKTRFFGLSNIYYLYIIFNVKSMTQSLEDFIKYGIITPMFSGKNWKGKVQVPIAFYNNYIYVGYYPNKSYSNLQFYKSSFDMILDSLESYYLDKGVSSNKIQLNQKNDGKTFIENIYPSHNIYHHNIDIGFYGTIEMFFYPFLLTGTLNIIFGINVSISFFIYLIVLFIFYLVKKYYNLKRLYCYKKIFINQPDIKIFLKKLIKSLKKNGFLELEHNKFKKSNEYLYIIDKKFKIESFDKKSKYFIVIMNSNYEEEIIKKLENLVEKFQTKNIFLTKFENKKYLEVLYSKNYKMHEEFFELINDIYNL